jgi:hypothetical protein
MSRQVPGLYQLRSFDRDLQWGKGNVSVFSIAITVARAGEKVPDLRGRTGMRPGDRQLRDQKDMSGSLSDGSDMRSCDRHMQADNSFSNTDTKAIGITVTIAIAVGISVATARATETVPGLYGGTGMRPGDGKLCSQKGMLRTMPDRPDLRPRDRHVQDDGGHGDTDTGARRIAIASARATETVPGLRGRNGLQPGDGELRDK